MTGNAITSALVTFNLEIAAVGRYSVRIHTPGCLQDSSCATRGSVSVTGTLYSVPGSENETFTTQVSQKNNFDKYDVLYDGLVNMSTAGFVPSVKVTPVATGIQNGLLTMVAQQVEGLFNASASSTGTTTGTSSTSSAPSTDASNPPTSTPSSSSKGGLSTGSKIGLGVGLPLGIIAVAVLLAILYITRRRKSSGERQMPPEVDGTSAHRELSTNANTAEMHAPPSYQELRAEPQSRPVELKATY